MFKQIDLYQINDTTWQYELKDTQFVANGVMTFNHAIVDYIFSHLGNVNGIMKDYAICEGYERQGINPVRQVALRWKNLNMKNKHPFLPIFPHPKDRLKVMGAMSARYSEYLRCAVREWDRQMNNIRKKK